MRQARLHPLDTKRLIPIAASGTRSYAFLALLLAIAAGFGFIAGARDRFRVSDVCFDARRPASPDIFIAQSDGHTPQKCPSRELHAASPPAAKNVWAPLSSAEILDVKEWLFKPSQGLNLTEGANSTDSDNIVFLIEHYNPAKSDALGFLDDSKSPPPRYARVTINHGGVESPVTRDYLVGPLPTSSTTTIRQLTEIYHREDIPFNARGVPDVISMFGALGKTMAPLEAALKDLFNGTIKGDLLADTFTAGPSGGWGVNGSSRRYWVSWKVNAPGSWLLPSNLYTYVDSSGTDPSQWSVLKRIGKPRELDTLPGPRSVSFAGLRFKVDKKQGLWDVRFRGERIAYQIAPQECLVQYTGHDPVQSITTWMDRFFGMGMFTKDLFPNYDCPAEAVFLPATLYHPLLGPIMRERAICIFEMDTGRPLTRHYGDFPGESGAVKGYVLTVRSIATLGNYDYLVRMRSHYACFDYIFHLDGTIEVKVSASGYLQGGYWTPDQAEYGSRINRNNMGNVHDHVINFKVDLDIAGVNNTFRKTTSVVEPVSLPWLDDDDWRVDGHNREVLQHKLAFTYVDQEGDASRTITKSNRMLKNANWAAHNLAVSLRKDTEPSSSMDFDKFFDGEDIAQKDLVLWINVGTHHQPVAEDAPTTKTNLAASSFFLAPVNYFDSDIAMESLNAITLDLVGTDPTSAPAYQFDDNGVPQDFNCISDAPPSFSYDPQVG
ncbi:hypothetical protein D9611_011504 [Ephemerocybe angulata]|uniref:Amine oxidase n=1 Tax=Ephemerocybe angulata TaxID=980116 RepID=A0A8H5CEG7_9AGAR|nr:hypothetical protein D9611_011504 [Tulosesus angulatus]